MRYSSSAGQSVTYASFLGAYNSVVRGWEDLVFVLVCVFIIVFVCKYVFSVTCIVAAFVLSFFAHVLVKK